MHVQEPQETAFLYSFERAARHLALSPEDIVRAKNALSELYAKYTPVVTQAAAASSWFAGHGESHGVRLGRVATDLIKAFVPKSEKMVIADIRSLLLSYAAFLFHDIGMSIPPHAGGSLLEMAKQQTTRHGHDERSLEFIEQTFVDNHRDFHHWNSFWSDANVAGEWPSPEGRYAFIVLARICKSHGDDIEVWLQPGSLDEYEWRLKDGNEIFPNKFQNKWHDIVDVIYASATLLCICDLCDVGPDRYRNLPEEWKIILLPEDREQRAWSFIHHLSHQTSLVEFRTDYIAANISGSSQFDWAYYVVVYCGAVADLLFWGNHPSLIHCVRKYICKGYSGAKVEQSVIRDPKWDEIVQEMNSEYFSECWPHAELNEYLSLGSEYGKDDTQLLSIIYRGIAKSLIRDIPSTHDFVLYEALLAIAYEGGLVDQLAYCGKVSPKEAVYDISLSAHDSHSDARTSRLCGALKVVRDLIQNDIPTGLKIRFTYHSASTFDDLLGGKPEELANSIYLVDVRDPQHGDRRKYTAIVENFADNKHNIFVVFIGIGLSDGLDFQHSDIQTVACEFDETKLSSLANNSKNQISLSRGEITLKKNGDKDADISVGSCKSVGALIDILWMRGEGLDSFTSKLVMGLEKSDRQYEEALSFLAFLTFAECLSLENDIARKEPLHLIYQKFSAAHHAERIFGWDQLCSALPEEFFVNGHAIHMPRAVVNTVHAQILANVPNAMWFRYYTGIYILQDEQFALNLSAEALEKCSLSIGRAKSILNNIAGKNVSDTAKVQVSIALGDFLGKRVCSEELALSEVLKIFPPRKFRPTLYSSIDFQTAYRIARQSIETIEPPVLVSASLPDAVRLGFLEALCRQFRDQGSLSKGLRSIIRDILTSFASGREKKTLLGEMVAFDIVWKYCKDNSAFRAEFGAFIEPCVKKLWDSAAEYFHSHPSRLDRAKEWDIAGIDDWIKFRNYFKFVLEETPTEVRRNMGDN